MTARKLFLFSIVLSALIFTGMPNPKPKVHATTTPGGADYAIILPFTINVYGFDTTITIGGNSQGLEDAPYLDLYYYDTSGVYQGCYHVSENVPAATDSENTQWVFNLSTTTGLAGHDGMYVAFTNLPDAKATYFISDANTTQATGNGQAVIDYNICGIDQDNKIVRRAGTDPPEDWHLIDPASNQVDPSLLHTTLYFPFVTNAAGWDTGINITNTFDATGVGDRYIHFYFYNSTGAFVCSWDQPIPGGGDVSGIYRFAMSAVNSNALAGQTGSLWAIVDIPFAYGCEFLSCNGSASGAGLPAVVNNNVYGVDPVTHAIKRTVEPQDNHTSVVVPFAATANGFETCLAVANTIKRETSINVDFYLYNMDGTRKTVGPPEALVPVQWRTTLNCDDIGASALVLMNSSGISVNEGDPFFTDIGNFIGWMLIIVDAPEASVPFVMNFPYTNLMDASMGVVKNKITGVSPETGQTLWDNPAPIDTETTFSVPFHSSLAFPPAIFQTWGIDVNTRNASETTANTVITSNGWDTTGAALIPHPRVVSVAPGAGPILASHMGVDWIDSPNIMGRQEDVANRSDVVRLTVIVDTGGQKDFVFIPNCYAFVGNAKALVVGDFKNWPVLPANGGTKKVKFTVNDTSVNVKTTNSANTVGVTMALTALNGGTISAPDQNGYITLQAGKEYEMTLTSAQKAAGDNWAVDNINVEFTDGVNAPENYKFTVFWVILDSPNNCNVTGQDLPEEPNNPLNSHPWITPCGIFDLRKLRDASASVNWGSRKAGKVLSDYNQGMGMSSTVIFVRGKVAPSGIQSGNFFSITEPKKDPLNNSKGGFRFKRKRWARGYFQRGEKTYFADHEWVLNDPADQAHPLRFHINADNADDNPPNNCDADLHPDADNVQGELFIYHMDTPSVPYSFVPCVDDTFRSRCNFTEWVEYGRESQKCSDNFQWTSAQSIKRTAANVVASDNTHANDNQITINNTINLTPDLQQGNTAIFSVDGLIDGIITLPINGNHQHTLKIAASTAFPNGAPSVSALKTSATGPDITISNVQFIEGTDRKQVQSTFTYGDNNTDVDTNPGTYLITIKFAGTDGEVVCMVPLRAVGKTVAFGQSGILPAGGGFWVVDFWGIDAAGNATGQAVTPTPEINNTGDAVEMVGGVGHNDSSPFYYYRGFQVKGNGTATFHCESGSIQGDSPAFRIESGTP